MNEQIRELALSDLGTTLMILVEQVEILRNSLVQRSLIMDSQIIAHREVKDETRAVLEELREELAQFRSDRQICGQLNILADHNNKKTGESNGTTFIDRLLE